MATRALTDDDLHTLGEKQLELLKLPLRAYFIELLRELFEHDAIYIMNTASLRLETDTFIFNKAELLLLTILANPCQLTLLQTPGFFAWLNRLITAYNNFFDTSNANGKLEELIQVIQHYQGGSIASTLAIRAPYLYIDSQLAFTTLYFTITPAESFHLLLEFLLARSLLNVRAIITFNSSKEDKILNSKTSLIYLAFFARLLNAFGLYDRSLPDPLSKYLSDFQLLRNTEEDKKIIAEQCFATDSKIDKIISARCKPTHQDFNRISFEAREVQPTPLILDMIQAILDKGLSIQLIVEIFQAVYQASSHYRARGSAINFDLNLVYTARFRMKEYSNREYSILSCIALRFISSKQDEIYLKKICKNLSILNKARFKIALNEAIIDVIEQRHSMAFDLLAFLYQNYDLFILDETKFIVAKSLSVSDAPSSSATLFAPSTQEEVRPSIHKPEDAGPLAKAEY